MKGLKRIVWKSRSRRWFLKFFDNFSVNWISQVPRQANSNDCGCFVIHFARTFLLDPNSTMELIKVEILFIQLLCLLILNSSVHIPWKTIACKLGDWKVPIWRIYAGKLELSCLNTSARAKHMWNSRSRISFFLLLLPCFFYRRSLPCTKYIFCINKIKFLWLKVDFYNGLVVVFLNGDFLCCLFRMLFVLSHNVCLF